jgi:hypothetical protein
VFACVSVQTCCRICWKVAGVHGANLLWARDVNILTLGVVPEILNKAPNPR